jgi:hypothetical protein
MTVRIVTMQILAFLQRMLLFRQPSPHFRRFGHGIVDIARHQLRRRQRSLRGIEPHGGAVEHAQLRHEALDLRLRRDVGLADHDAIRHRHLLARLLVILKGRTAILRIDDGDDIAEPEMVADHRIVHKRGDDRCRIGKPRRLDDEAVELRHRSPFAAIVEIANGLAEIAPDGAAQTAALQDHHALVDPLKEMVIEADLAELVDEHRRIAEFRRGQQALEQSRLAAAQKAGDEVDGKHRVKRLPG